MAVLSVLSASGNRIPFRGSRGVATPDAPVDQGIRCRTDVLWRSDAAFFFDDKDAGFAARVCNVFATCASIEHISGLQGCDVLCARFSVMHVDRAVKDGEDFFPVVHMPSVGLVGPVQAYGNAAHVWQCRAPPRRSQR